MRDVCVLQNSAFRLLSSKCDGSYPATRRMSAGSLLYMILQSEQVCDHRSKCPVLNHPLTWPNHSHTSHASLCPVYLLIPEYHPQRAQLSIACTVPCPATTKLVFKCITSSTQFLQCYGSTLEVLQDSGAKLTL